MALRNLRSSKVYFTSSNRAALIFALDEGQRNFKSFKTETYLFETVDEKQFDDVRLWIQTY